MLAANRAGPGAARARAMARRAAPGARMAGRNGHNGRDHRASHAGCDVLQRGDPHHEAIEAMRWARALMASGQAKPEEIAIATTSAGDHDASFLSLRADADFALHFVHGLPVTATRDGQAAAALADIVARGLSRLRLHRLVSLTGADSPMLTDLPEGWIRILGTAPLDTPDAWGRLLSGRSAGDWPDGMDHGPALRVLVDLLHRGPRARARWANACWRGVRA